MKRLLSIVLFLSTVLFAAAQGEVREIPKPPPGSMVNDLAGVLDPQEEQLLNERLIGLDNSSSNQIAVATIKSLNGGDLEEVAVNTYRAWGIGTAKKDNGVLIIVVVDDRKMRIEVGYGLEGAIPDATAGSIIRNDMRPYFQKNDYYHGILAAVENLGKAAVGEYNEPRQQKDSGGSGGFSIFKFILIAIFILIFIGRSGGGGGKRGGRVYRRGGSDWLGPLIIGSMLGGSRGGGGGFGGGGFGGGGFGGFGGGSSGGGGASGSW